LGNKDCNTLKKEGVIDLRYAFINLKNQFAYKWAIVFSVFSSILSIWITIQIWEYLYRNDSNKIEYMIGYVVLSNVISLFYCRGIGTRIAERVRTGMISLDLLKPINVFFMNWQLEIGRVISDVLLKGIPILLVFGLFINIRIMNFVLGVLAVVIGHIICTLIYSALGFLSVVLYDIWPFQRFVDDTIRLFGGSFLPIGILPLGLSRICKILPFRFMYSFPIEVILNNSLSEKLVQDYIIGIIWVVALALLNKTIYHITINKIVIQGG
jgi:ABC-2 type transport system permease protein